MKKRIFKPTVKPLSQHMGVEPDGAPICPKNPYQGEHAIAEPNVSQSVLHCVYCAASLEQLIKKGGAK